MSAAAVAPEPPSLVKGGLIGEVRNIFRVRNRTARTVAWRKPEDDAWTRFADHPVFSQYADFLDAVAEVEGETWLIYERIWAGWPDPPTYAFIFLSPEGEVVAAADRYTIPRTWRMPEGFKAR